MRRLRSPVFAFRLVALLLAAMPLFAIGELLDPERPGRPVYRE